jgi:hypothetical protein
VTVDLQRAVAKGAELLDHAMPGWAERVDPDILDMRLMSTCVLGQLGGGWAESTICVLFGADPTCWWRPDPLEDGWEDNYAIIGMPLGRTELRHWAVEHGLDLDTEDAADEESWDVLGDLWRSHIEWRLRNGVGQ